MLWGLPRRGYVRRWVLDVPQRDEAWTTEAAPQSGVIPHVLARRRVSEGPDVAVAVALANDITDAVASYISAALPHVGELVVLGPEGDPGGSAVPSNAWLTAWVRAARNEIRRTAASARRIHLFLSGPASAALLLGHQWNTLPAPTTVYEYERTRRTYFRRSISADPAARRRRATRLWRATGSLIMHARH
jgi:hypothetical protein